MSNTDFVECWLAACRHDFVSFSEEQRGAHSFLHTWNATVGALTLTVWAMPYLEGRHDLSEITVRGHVSGSEAADEPLTGEQAKLCVNVWKVRQCLERPIDKARVLELIRTGR